MTTKTLTAIAVKKHRSRDERREIADGGCPGLYLIVQPSGRKSWALRFRRPNGKPGKLTLGPVDLSGKEHDGEPVAGTPLSLASARKLAAEVHRDRARGRDPIADHDTNKRHQRFENASRAQNTFAAACRDFIEQHAMPKTRRWQGTARQLGLDPRGDLELINGGLADRWADKPVASITAHDIHDIIDETRRLGVPGSKRRSEGVTENLARSMRSTLSTMFDWLQRNRRVASNPCSGVPSPVENPARERVLTDAEIVKFWRATDSVQQPFGAALKLLLISGCRREEVGGMLRQSELSDDLSTWNIPGSRTKNKRPHVVPLPPAARGIIAALPNTGDLVFGSGAPWSRIKAQLDKAMKGVPAWRIHDLRRTAATGMAEIGIAPHIIEACLNHVSGAKAGVAGTYNRAQYADEKKAALERWAAHVEGLVEGQRAKVVPIRAHKG